LITKKKKKKKKVDINRSYLITFYSDYNKFVYIQIHVSFLSNARDTTNFTTKCLQTDMASHMEVTHQQLMIY
jgi:hypothetical protein